MEYTTLKNSDLRVSRLCMGGCPMGGYGWGDTAEQELIGSVQKALEYGVNFFDTANTYGFGKSEEILGKALGTHRRDVVIQSKFGVRVMEDMVGRKTIYDNSPDYIEKALDGTLQRLGTDYIDIYTIHYRDKETPMADVVDTLKQLQQKGKVRYFGLSNIHEDGMNEVGKYKSDFVCCQDEYSLACRKNEPDLNKINKVYGITPLTWGSLGQGILTGKYSKDTVFGGNDRRCRDVYVNFHGEKMQRNLNIVESMKSIASEHAKPVSAVAIRFILDWLKDSVVLVGAKRPNQIERNVESMDWKLSEEELDVLNKVSADNSLVNDSGGVLRKGGIT